MLLRFDIFQDSPGLFPHCFCWKFTEVAHDDCTLLQQDWTVGIGSPHQGCDVKTFSAQPFSEGCNKSRCSFQPAPFGQIGFLLHGVTRVSWGFARIKSPKVSFQIVRGKQRWRTCWNVWAAKLQRCEQWVVSQPPNRSSWTPFCQRSFPGQACHPKEMNVPTGENRKKGLQKGWNNFATDNWNLNKLQKKKFEKSYTFRLNQGSNQISTEHQKKSPRSFIGGCCFPSLRSLMAYGPYFSDHTMPLDGFSRPCSKLQLNIAWNAFVIHPFSGKRSTDHDIALSSFSYILYVPFNNDDVTIAMLHCQNQSSLPRCQEDDGPRWQVLRSHFRPHPAR